MDDFNKLSSLIERVKWLGNGYKETARAHKISLEAFARVTAEPRETSWKQDTVIASFLKYCDTQTLSLQSMQKISQMVANDLESALDSVSHQLLSYQKQEDGYKHEMVKAEDRMHTAAEKRNNALKGESDVWKADLDLKHCIKDYIRKEEKHAQFRQTMSHIYQTAYNDALKMYYTTLREYMLSAHNHLNILLSDLKELSSVASNSHLMYKLADKTFDLDRSLTQPSEDRFAELYQKTAQEKDAHNGLYPFLVDLSVRGCGLFYTSKLSNTPPVFLVLTSTQYIHAFSTTNLFCGISNSLFIAPEPHPPAEVSAQLNQAPRPRSLCLSNENELEEIHLYLLAHLEDLPVHEKGFPFSIKDKKVSLAQNNKEIIIEDKSSLFFSNKLKLRGMSHQQIRKFYALFAVQEPTTPGASLDSEPEVVISWSSASFDNPWQ
ncbi:hypothetical protein NEHOM01_2424 [Nematocida homosporus]|uniref:uncharacterized protein n=1 Tax=Nematocida homosporus TaxID=1912981 RepID=UPI0022203C6C|nr:uncharacterized protein NEHOM01_2424 [Nematocida homosporus]KAI5187880.1 hypothetical protein NEHOM01_2424 [Nematocida homosporus]